MARVFNYLVLATGLMMLFYIAGINTASGYVLNNLNVFNPSGIGITNIVTLIAGIFAAAVFAGVVIGFFTKSPTESILLAGYAEVLLLFIADLLFIVIYMEANYGGWLATITGLIMMPLVVGYIHSVVSWWGGKG